MDAQEANALLEALVRRARQAADTGHGAHSRFLDTGIQKRLETALLRELGGDLSFNGGYAGAQRRIACFGAVSSSELPVALHISWNARFADIGHRDMLGAMLGLGIQRDCIGDIAMGEPGECYAFITADMADFLQANLNQAGRATLKVERAQALPDGFADDGKTMRATLASLRLDAVAGAGMRLARGKAVALIQQGRVSVNGQLAMKASVQVAVGDVISIRGMGRVVLIDTGDTLTRKGRMGVELRVYG